MNLDLQLTVLLVFMVLGAIVAVETRDLLSSVISVGMVGFGTSVGFLILGAPDLAITQVVVEIICLVILIRATVVRDETVLHRYTDTFAMAAGIVALAVLMAACTAIYVQKRPGRGLPPMGRPVALEPMTLEKRVQVTDPGDSRLRPGALLSEAEFDRLQVAVARSGGKALRAVPEPRGISRRYLDERADLYLKARSADVVHTANRVCAIVLDYRGYDTLGEATVILTGILGALVILRQKGKRDGRTE
jgi:multisubunit Na+/H+ antiporter MnhB subunit